MSTRARLLILLLLSNALAEEAGTVFRNAVRQQGNLRRSDVACVHLVFKGQIVREKEEHLVQRDYWYRSADRAFRIRTVAQARQRERSERSVLGRDFFEHDGARAVRLRRANRDHRQVIEAIDEERRNFERMLQLVLLSQLEGARISLAQPEPVTIPKDYPWEARRILGEDRAKRTYHVLDVRRDKAPRRLLYVRTDDFTVRKVVQYSLDDPAKPEFFYYFGPFEKRRKDGLTLPLFFSIHDALPTDRATRKSTSVVYGEISVDLETALKDEDFRLG